MSNDATVKFGFDGRELNAGLAASERRLVQFGNAAEATGARMTRNLEKRGSGAGFRGVGNAAMQIQDIAIQAQMGARASTIIAQQGSQLLSAFGPGGMILGGVVAIGAIAYETKQKSAEIFKELQKEAGEMEKTYRRISSGSLAEMIDGMDTFKKRSEELRQGLKDSDHGSFLNGVRRFFSSSTFDPESGKWTNQDDASRKQAADNAASAEEKRNKLINDTRERSMEELQILRKKAAGEETEAEMMELQLRQKREMAKLDDAPKEVKGRLVTDLKERHEIEMRMLKEKQSSEANAAREKEAAAARELRQRRETIESDKRSVEMMELQAKGRDKQLKKLKEEEFVRTRSQEYQSHGLDPKASIELAQRAWRAQESVERRARGGRSHIGGVGSKRMMGGGLDEFFAMQGMKSFALQNSLLPGSNPDDPRRIFVPQFAGSLADRRPRTGRMMGGGAGVALTDRAAISTSGAMSATNAANAMTSSRSSVTEKIDTTNQILAKGLLGR